MSIPLIYLGIAELSAAATAPVAFGVDLVAAVGGIFLLLGLFTPAVTILVALDQAWIGFSQNFPPHGVEWIHVLLAALVASLAMLGPGAWSIDARLFGRRVYDIGPSSRGDGHPR